jgi:virginiamycin A acetyltransferase
MAIHRLPAHQRVVFLKPLVTSPTIVIGEYTYYHDPDDRPASSTATCSTATAQNG